MMGRIKKFNEFDNRSEIPKLDEGIFGDLMDAGGNIFGFLKGGFINTIKQKALAWFLEYFGIVENSPLSKIMQEVFEEIEISDYYDIVSGKKANMDYFIPRISKAVAEFLRRTGFDGIAESIGIAPEGLLYNTIRETIEEKMQEGNGGFSKEIEKILRSILKPGESGLTKILEPKEVIKSMPSGDKNKALKGFMDLAKKTGNEIPKDAKDKGFDIMTDFISNALKNSNIQKAVI